MSNQAKTAKLTNGYKSHHKVINYKVADQGGAVGDIGLKMFVPANAFITRVYLEKVTAFTSDGAATFSLYLLAANDILTATQYDNAIFTGTFGATTPVDTPASFLKNTESIEKEIIARIGTADLTAGEYNIHVEYIA